jgi:surface protein
MSFMFCKSPFNGDISNWNVSNVTTMERMFDCSEFNGDISKWDVSNVEYMNSMFYDSNFMGDISKWKPYSLTSDIRSLSKAKKINVYWTNYKDQETRNKAIDSYWLEKELQKELIDNKSENKKIKL